MQKVAASILVGLILIAGSYFFLLIITLNTWEIPALGYFFGWLFSWLFTSHSGQGVIFLLILVALWPFGEREHPRNIIRRIPQHEEKNKIK